MTGMTLDYRQTSPSLRTIDALADATGTDPLELEPLYSVIDPEALDQFVAGAADDATSVEFVYDGHDVAVHGDGTVVVDGTTYENERS